MPMGTRSPPGGGSAVAVDRPEQRLELLPHLAELLRALGELRLERRDARLVLVVRTGGDGGRLGGEALGGGPVLICKRDYGVGVGIADVSDRELCNGSERRLGLALRLGLGLALQLGLGFRLEFGRRQRLCLGWF